MKRLLALLIAIVGLIILGACGPQGQSSPQLSIPTGSLDTAEEYLKRGDQYSEIQDYDRAIINYTRAIQLKPDYAEAYNNRGLAYALSSKSEMANAIADYTRAIQSRPAYAYAYNNRGVAYMASGHAKEALDDFDTAIQLQPNLVQAYSNRGNAYNRMGRIDLAIPDFIRAVIPPRYLPLLSILALSVLLAIGLACRFIRMRVLDPALRKKGRGASDGR